MVPMQILIFLFTLYFFVIGFCGMWRKKEVKIKTPRKTFALVVAAHNEHAVIGQLVENLKQLNYPKDMYDIYVIADNDGKEQTVFADEIVLLERTKLFSGSANALERYRNRMIQILAIMGEIEKSTDGLASRIHIIASEAKL